MLGSIIRVLIGFVLACLVAGLVQVLFVTPPNEIVALPDDKLLDELESLGFLSLAVATQAAVFSAPFALILALIGEWQSIRSWTFYALGGMLIAGAGFLAQYAAENPGQPTIVNTYALAAFLAAGFVAGIMYWMAAGSRAGTSEPAPAAQKAAAQGA